MKTYNFIITITPPNMEEEVAAEALYETNCSDALFSVSEGIYTVEFDRMTTSFIEAIKSAMYDILTSGIGSSITNISFNGISDLKDVK